MNQHALPIGHNVVALHPSKTMRHVTLLRLDGTLFATAGFLPGLASAPWDWIVETVAHELGCAEDAVGCQEGGDDDLEDFVTVDGLRVYRIAL